MKRILSMALAAALLIASLAACGGAPDNTASPTEPAEENTAAPATQPSDASQEPSLALPTEEPSDEPAGEPTDKLQAPGGQADLAAFAETAAENHEFSGFLERIDPSDPDMGEMMSGMLDNYYPGLTDLELEQMEIYMSMISFGSGELALAQARSAGDAGRVKDIFQARADSKSAEGAGNYPEEVELWQRSSRVAVNGNYVLLVCSEDCEAIVSEFNALFK